jgi:uncharacterized membrane protein
MLANYTIGLPCHKIPHLPIQVSTTESDASSEQTQIKLICLADRNNPLSRSFYSEVAATRCRNCGIEMVAGAAFCPSCGKPVGLASDLAARTAARAVGLPPNIAGALCYLAGFITGILFLVLEPYRQDRFVRFHAFQSIFFSSVWIMVYFALAMLLSQLPRTTWRLVVGLSTLLSLALFGVALWLTYKAYSNERFKVPLIGDLAEKHV